MSSINEIVSRPAGTVNTECPELWNDESERNAKLEEANLRNEYDCCKIHGTIRAMLNAACLSVCLFVCMPSSGLIYMHAHHRRERGYRLPQCACNTYIKRAQNRPPADFAYLLWGRKTCDFRVHIHNPAIISGSLGFFFSLFSLLPACPDQMIEINDKTANVVLCLRVNTWD